MAVARSGGDRLDGQQLPTAWAYTEATVSYTSI